HRTLGIALEAAVAITEAAFLGVERVHLKARAIEQADRGDHLRDLLAVRPDVLDRRRADQSGNPRQALDAREIALDRVRAQLVPRLARRRVDPHARPAHRA